MTFKPRNLTGLLVTIGLICVSQIAIASTFMPPAITKIAAEVDTVYAFLLIASLISFVGLVGAMIYFVFKYQRGSGSGKSAYITHNHTLEFLWSFIPFCLFVFLFGWGWKIMHEQRHAPNDALEVHVLAKKWDWRFLYKNGKEVHSGLDDSGQKTPATMVVPVGRPVKLIMGSEKISANSTDPNDRPVVHSFFLPATRLKQDIVPGMFTMVWFNIEKPGDYWVFCAEFCGAGHSSMKAIVRAVPEPEFDQWLADEGGGVLSLADQGKALFSSKACVGCHSADGSRIVGPTFKGLWGEKTDFEGGGSVLVDENYLRDSILNPNSKIVKGYPAGVMPAFAGQLSEEEVNAIIEFIKTLK